jgi:alpha-beta hydrolase superfamily lysophospholipase
MTSTHPPIGQRAGFFSRKTLVRSLQIFVAIAIVYLSIAAGLIYWPRSAPFPAVDHATTAEDLRSEDISAADTRASHQFTARDGSVLVAKRHGPATDKVILLLHGVASNQSHMLLPAEMLSEASDLEVIALDLRGHGLSDGPRNDVDYIGQYEDDVEDVIRALKAEAPGRTVILAGHSMGGGIAMRYALKDDAPKPAAYLLFAPNFGEGPTEGGGASEEEPGGTPSVVHFDLPRMIGQVMMNVAGIHAFDREPILYFNFPPQVQAYSYRAVMSGQPIRPQTSDKALQAIDVPLLVVVGENDEVFNAAAFEGVISANSDGKTKLIAGENHVSILFSKRGFEAVRDWFATEALGET